MLYRKEQWSRGGLVLKAHILWHHSILGVRAKKKKESHVGWDNLTLKLDQGSSFRAERAFFRVAFIGKTSVPLHGMYQ